ncbi:MAG: response regulator, partial [Verrucomicrobiaceae bacterium]
DLQMPEMDGFETCELVMQSYPEIKILVVSQLTTKEVIHKIMQIGVHGFFSKNTGDKFCLESSELSRIC